MKTIVAVVAIAIASAMGAYFLLKPPAPPSSMLDAAAPMDEAAIQRGAYLSRLGDCGACHTADGGKPMAGGRAFDTPMGRLYSSNITPDPKAGIGGDTLAQFEGALRRGVAADGSYLYPAMPYPSFAKISDEDVRALYAYFMKGVAPADTPDKASEMRWPFNIRLGLALWDKAFLDRSRFSAIPAKDPQWNRGAYIAEGLGHCGACHTPRGLAMQELVTREDGRVFLSGATVWPWRAPDLRHLWPEPDIAQFLKTGVNGHGTAYGDMTEVVGDSSQYFSDSDLAAVGHFLASLGEAPPRAGVPPPGPAEGLYSTRGGLGYVQFCSACHRRDGEGAPGIFPPLAGNDSILSDDATSVIHIALTGWTMASTQFSAHAFSMPEYSSLSDEELAEILTFVRTSWGNHASPVQAGDIKNERAALSPVSTADAKFNTPRFADLLARPDSAELIEGMRLVTETRQLLPHSVGDELSCSSCHLDGGTTAHGSPFVGLTPLFPSYNARAGRVITIEDRINGCFRRSMTGATLADDSPDMRAMVAFMNWMKDAPKTDGKIEGRGVAKITDTLAPDASRGKTLFDANCAVCHGQNGEGLRSKSGEWIFPPLWGDNSFDIGAGIARTYTAAGFVKANMPIARSRKFPQGQGGLSDQDALDIADYFTHQPRPDFPDKANDWPKGGRPKDSRY